MSGIPANLPIFVKPRSRRVSAGRCGMPSKSRSRCAESEAPQARQVRHPREALDRTSLSAISFSPSKRPGTTRVLRLVGSSERWPERQAEEQTLDAGHPPDRGEDGAPVRTRASALAEAPHAELDLHRPPPADLSDRAPRRLDDGTIRVVPVGDGPEADSGTAIPRRARRSIADSGAGATERVYPRARRARTVVPCAPRRYALQGPREISPGRRLRPDPISTRGALDFGPFLLLATLEGLVMAAVLALTAVGLSLVFGVMRVVNVAHGEFFMLGAVLAWTVAHLFANPALGFLAALVVCPSPPPSSPSPSTG